jgi:hypothetical protein
MKSFQIRKWQDNYAETCSKEKDKDENLVNAVLECANQLAEINERLEEADFKPNVVVNVDNNLLPGLHKIIPPKYWNDKGEIDLSQVTGEEAREYFIKFLGISFPVGVSRTKLR